MSQAGVGGGGRERERERERERKEEERDIDSQRRAKTEQLSALDDNQGATRKSDKKERAEGRRVSEMTTVEETRKKTTISIPYFQGTSEAIWPVLGQLGISTAMRSSKIKWSIKKGAKDKQKEVDIPGVA